MANAPTADDLKRLDAAATAFWKLAPWMWADYTDAFAIDDPSFGMVFVACDEVVFGRMPGVYLFFGARGLDAFARLRIALELRSVTDQIFRQDALVLTHVDPSMDEPGFAPALKTFTRLQRTLQPQLIRYRYGMIPRPADRDEVRLLVSALDVGLEMFARLRDDSDEFARFDPKEKEEQMLVLTRDGDRWVEQRRSGAGIYLLPTRQEFEMRRAWTAARALPQRDTAWEFGLLFMPDRVEGTDELQCIHLIVDGEGETVNQEVARRRSDDELCEFLVHAIVMARYRPSVLLTDDLKLDTVLGPLASALGIDLDLAEELPFLTPAYAEILAPSVGIDLEEAGDVDDDVSFDEEFVLPRDAESVELIMPPGFRHERIIVRYVPMPPDHTESLAPKDVARIQETTLDALENPKAGLKKMRALAAEFPSIPAVHANLVSTLVGLGKTFEARKAAVRNFERFPGYLFGISAYCDFMLIDGNTDAAEAAFGGITELPDLLPERTEFHFSEVATFHGMLARIHQARGRTAEAERYSEVLRRAVPGHPLLEMLEAYRESEGPREGLSYS
jgi:hypothetical protein